MKTSSILLSLGLSGLAVAAAPGCGGSSGSCVVDQYPEAPGGASDVVHASANCPADSADGSAEHPYPTISAAIQKSKAGGVILVAPGTYPENLTIDKDLSVIGPAKVGQKGDEAGIILQAPNPNAIVVKGGATANLVGFSVVSPKEVGVWASGGTAHVTSCKVEGAKLDGNGQYGYGFLASSDGAIILQDSAALSSAGVGILVNGATATVTSCEASNNASGGLRVDQGKAMITVDDTTFTGNTYFGIGLFGGTAKLTNNTISNTKPDATYGIADGIEVSGALDDQGNVLAPASVEASGNTITGVGRVGAIAAKGAGGIILQNNGISGSGQTSFGAGIWLQEGAGDASSKILDNHLTGNKFAGLGLTGDTHGIILQNNEVSGTVLATYFEGTASKSIGDGISLFDGASAKLTGNVIGKNGRAGIIFDSAAGTATTLDNNQITDNDQYGIILQNQPDMPAFGMSTVSGNKLGAQAPAGMMFDVNKDAFATP